MVNLRKESIRIIFGLRGKNPARLDAIKKKSERDRVRQRLAPIVSLMIFWASFFFSGERYSEKTGIKAGRKVFCPKLMISLSNLENYQEKPLSKDEESQLLFKQGILS